MMTVLGLWLRHGMLPLFILCIGSSAAISQTRLDHPGTAVSGQTAGAARVIVKFRSDSALLRKHALSATADADKTLDALNRRANSLGARLGMNLHAGRALDARTQVVRASGMDSATLAKRLDADADVEYAIPDQRRKRHAMPNDPFLVQGPPVSGSTGGPSAGQWYLRAPAGEITSSINAVGAWEVTAGSPDIAVAVLDTGVRPEHPDLAHRLLDGYDMISDVPTANDGDGRDADASDPGDWVTARESGDWSSPFFMCDIEDSSWHGTKVASLIGAATNDGSGMAGVAGGVKLLPVRVLGKCGGYDSDIIAGMSWAAGLPVPGMPANPAPARVINMSLGGSGACPQSYLDAIGAIMAMQYPAVIVAAAGNSTGSEVGAPANCPDVIGVASLRHVGTKVGFSDIGPEISISAPGGNCVNEAYDSPCLYPILAASNSGRATPSASSYTDSFNASVGTSYSAPLVAGTVALMLSVQPSLTPAEIKAALQRSARPFPSPDSGGSSLFGGVQDCHVPNGSDQLECYCTTSTCGAGMLDAAAAVAEAMPASDVVEFYNTGLDHYFITADADEAAGIANGSAGAGWVTTGNIFKSGGNQVACRFYGSQSPGPNSHFYTIDPGECAYLKQLQETTPDTQKRWNFEGMVFSATLPQGDACPSGTQPIYRAYNNGFAMGVDSNHRITGNYAAIQEVVARGWTDEGVVMCAR